MLDDHVVLSTARNELADALKVLLNPAIMGEADFRQSLTHTLAALNALVDLLCQPNGDPPKPGGA
jgi:hypothetical protein